MDSPSGGSDEEGDNFEEFPGAEETWDDREDDAPADNPPPAVLEDSEESGDEEGNVYPQRKRPRLKDRLVNNLKSAQNEANYDPYTAPTEKKVTKSVIQKKTKKEPEVSISWQNQEFAKSRAGRPPARQLRQVPAGVIEEAQSAKTPLDCFQLFLPPEVISRLVRLTNANIERLHPNDQEPPDSKKGNRRKTDATELKAFLGLLYFRGLLQQNMWSVKRLFEDQIGHPIFSATMARDRFEFIRRVIKFDNPETRAERFRRDKFAAFRDFFEAWNLLCAHTVNPGDFVTIDECLYALRNKLSFKTYNPNKPSKYGINVKCLNEVVFPYTYRSEVFAGKPEVLEGAEFYIPSTHRITLRLLEMVGWERLQGCHLTVDNLYTSVPLAEELLQKKMTLLGTMRANRKGLTKEISETKNREENSTVVWHEMKKGQMKSVSYVVKTKSKGKGKKTLW